MKSGYTSLKLSADYKLKITNTLITGMHEPGTSHAKLMQAFCDERLLSHAEKEANQLGYRSHEYGDLALLDCRCNRASLRPSPLALWVQSQHR